MATDLARRIAITGAGAVGAFGVGTGTFWTWLDTDRRRFGPCSRYASPLPCAEAEKPDLRRMLRSGHLSRASLVSQFAVAAAHLALEQAGIRTGKGAPSHDIGLVYGTSTGPAAVTQEIYDDLIERGSAGVKPRLFQESVYNAPASVVSIHFGLKGPVQVIASGSCAPIGALSGTDSAGPPRESARSSRSAPTSCARGSNPRCGCCAGRPRPPGTANRRPAPDGERCPRKGRRRCCWSGATWPGRGNAPVRAELAGASSTNDAWRLARPAEDGGGWRSRCATAWPTPRRDRRRWAWCSRPSANTAVDDRLEAAALRSVFGDATPPMASIKDHVGYAMGAAAMLDVALAAEMVHRNGCPPPWTGTDSGPAESPRCSAPASA